MCDEAFQKISNALGLPGNKFHLFIAVDRLWSSSNAVLAIGRQIYLNHSCYVQLVVESVDFVDATLLGICDEFILEDFLERLHVVLDGIKLEEMYFGDRVMPHVRRLAFVLRNEKSKYCSALR